MALHYDLLNRGYNLDDLGTEALSWYDLMTFIKYLQTDHTSALSRELHGPTWSVDAQINALIADALAIANWQRAGRKTAPKPKPLPRPWDKPKTTSLGKGPIPLSQFDDWWDSQAPKKPPTTSV